MTVLAEYEYELPARKRSCQYCDEIGYWIVSTPDGQPVCTTCLRAQVDALTKHEWQTCEKHGLTFNTRFGCWRCAASSQDSGRAGAVVGDTPNAPCLTDQARPEHNTGKSAE